MASTWTTSKTWVVGEVLTAAGLNTYLRDNTNALRQLARASGTSSSLAYAWVAPVSVVDDYGSSWGATFWTAPMGGYFEVWVHGVWSGASGAGAFGVKAEQWNSTGATLKDYLCGTESSVINGRVSASAKHELQAGDRIYFGAYRTASGSAGSVDLRFGVSGG